MGKQAIKDEILKTYSNQGLCSSECEEKFNQKFDMKEKTTCCYNIIDKEKIMKD